MNRATVTVAERSEACTVFARSEAGIVGFRAWKFGVCVCMCICCVCVQAEALRRADHPSKESSRLSKN
jgi:hypothetical protein